MGNSTTCWPRSHLAAARDYKIIIDSRRGATGSLTSFRSFDMRSIVGPVPWKFNSNKLRLAFESAARDMSARHTFPTTLVEDSTVVVQRQSATRAVQNML